MSVKSSPLITRRIATPGRFIRSGTNSANVKGGVTLPNNVPLRVLKVALRTVLSVNPGQSCLLMMYFTESEPAVPAELGPPAAQLRLAAPVRHLIDVHDFLVPRKLEQS